MAPWAGRTKNPQLQTCRRGCNNVQILVIGHDGLLGSAVCRRLRELNIEPATTSVRWGTPAAIDDLTAAFHKIADDDEWAIAWCAGAGVPSSPQAIFDDEIATFHSFCEVIQSSGRGEHGTFFYPSSAGGVYAGSSGPPFTEFTKPQPLAPYGFAKLALEAEVQSLATAGVRGSHRSDRQPIRPRPKLEQGPGPGFTVEFGNRIWSPFRHLRLA